MVDQQVNLAPSLTAIRRVSPGFIAAQRGGTRLTVDRLPRPPYVALFSIEHDHFFQYRFKNTLPAPSLETFVQDTAADSEPITVHCFPLTAGPHHIPNAVQHRSILSDRTASPAATAALRNQVFNSCPQPIGHFEIVNILRSCVTIIGQGVSSLKVVFIDLLSNEIRLLRQSILFLG